VALDRMDRALGDFRVAGNGIHTTAEFLRTVVGSPRFRSGRYTTAILSQLAEKG
jgi:acetyl-CoA carboxylase biotin carboxylase subunit